MPTGVQALDEKREVDALIGRIVATRIVDRGHFRARRAAEVAMQLQVQGQCAGILVHGLRGVAETDARRIRF